MPKIKVRLSDLKDSCQTDPEGQFCARCGELILPSYQEWLSETDEPLCRTCFYLNEEYDEESDEEDYN